MRNLNPIRDKVIGRMLEAIGNERRTKGGLVLTEKNFGEETIRPRWFEVTHVGPDQKDVKAGNYILVPHGRWSRGLDFYGTSREEDKLFLLDNDAIMMVSDEPVS
jgi:co-chaperonin GroES (HSP10)